MSDDITDILKRLEHYNCPICGSNSWIGQYETFVKLPKMKNLLIEMVNNKVELGITGSANFDFFCSNCRYIVSFSLDVSREIENQETLNRER